jgi:hypothetical protein
MSPTETDMFDQPSKDAEKSPLSWRFLKLLGCDAPSAGLGRGRGKKKSRTPKEPEERKHQFAIWYIFVAFLGVMLVQFVWLRFTQVDTIPYSQFEQLVDQNKIAEVLAWISTEPNSPNLTPARLHILWAFSPCSVMLNGALIAFLRGVTWPHVFTFRGISAFLLAK